MFLIKLGFIQCSLEEEFEDIKRVIRRRKLKNTIIQWQKKTKKEQSMMYKVQKTKDQAARIPLKPRVSLEVREE